MKRLSSSSSSHCEDPGRIHKTSVPVSDVFLIHISFQASFHDWQAADPSFYPCNSQERNWGSELLCTPLPPPICIINLWLYLKPLPLLEVHWEEILSEREKQMSYINLYMWNLEKWYKWTYFQGRNWDTVCTSPLFSLKSSFLKMLQNRYVYSYKFTWPFLSKSFIKVHFGFPSFPSPFHTVKILLIEFSLGVTTRWFLQEGLNVT